VATTKRECDLELQYHNNFVDRRLRSCLHLFLSRDEMEAVGLMFDRVCKTDSRMSKFSFMKMMLFCGPPLRKECTNDRFVKESLALFDHARVQSRVDFVIPGKSHPYIAQRRQSFLKQLVLHRRGRKQGPDKSEIYSKDEIWLGDSLDLHELLLEFSFWKRLKQSLGDLKALSKMDDVTLYFTMFQAACKESLTEGELADALRRMLEGVFISEYEEAVQIPIDCDPSLDLQSNEDDDHFQAFERGISKGRKQRERDFRKRHVIERFLDVIFDDIDKIGTGKINLEDMRDWLIENPNAQQEFFNPVTKESTIIEAFETVGALDWEMDREKFYSFVENSHLMSFRFNDSLELKIFDLARSIAHEAFSEEAKGDKGDNDAILKISLTDFRAFLKNTLDTRLASMIVRVARCIRQICNKISMETVEHFLEVLKTQMEKPLFAEESASWSSKKFRSRSESMMNMRRKMSSRSALDQIRIAPIPQEIPSNLLSPSHKSNELK